MTDCYLSGGYDRDIRMKLQTALTYRYIYGPDTYPVKHPRASTGEDELREIFSSFSIKNEKSLVATAFSNRSSNTD
uniref:Uncharacterized protein n=1 Tax=Melicertus latisulcatus pemonivirus TaxID=2984278 RepID=A0A9C7CF29_9VIRU|nr:MAG: hypothetical protein [Melicertus latisulcatus pemonivirus]